MEWLSGQNVLGIAEIRTFSLTSKVFFISLVFQQYSIQSDVRYFESVGKSGMVFCLSLRMVMDFPGHCIASSSQNTGRRYLS